MNRRERKKAETRAKIITCAISLFREKGFMNTSMEEIAEKADIAKGTLYNYFPDKEEILVGYFQNYIAKHGQEFFDSLKDIPGIEAKLSKFLDFLTTIITVEKELAEIYLQFRMKTFLDYDPFNNPRRSGLEPFLVMILQEAQANKEIRTDIPALVLSRYLQFLIRSSLLSNVFSREPLASETLKAQLIGLFLNGAKI